MNIAPAFDFDNKSDDARLDVARLINAAGYHATARSVRRCGEEHRCHNRLCPTCKPAWKRRSCGRLLDAIKDTGADDVVCMVLTTIANTAAEATAGHRKSWARFARTAHFPLHGAFHLPREKVGGGRWKWLAHHHIFVSKRFVPDVMAAWTRVATRPANVKPIRTTLERAVAYVVKGAVEVPPCATDAIAWIRATRGRRLVTIRKGRTLKEESKRICSTLRTLPRESLIRKRIIQHIASESQSQSTLRKRFASFERATVDDVISELVNQRALWRIDTPHGQRLRIPLPADIFDALD